jgi:hypothetical protein
MASYQDFGAAFIDVAITPARLEEAVAAIAGPSVEVGPMGVGPGDAASVVAHGTIGAPTAKTSASDPDGTRRFVVAIPVELKLTVRVAGTTHRFGASVVARLHLAVRTAVIPLALVIDIAPPQVFDLEVDVRASGVAAKVLGRLGNVDNKIRKEVVNFIAGRLESDAARAATVIDISRQIDSVWHQAVSLPER